MVERATCIFTFRASGRSLSVVDQLPTFTPVGDISDDTVPSVVSLTGALLLAAVVFAMLALGGQIVVFLMLVVLGPVLAAALTAVAAVEIERAVLYLLTKWRAPRVRLALTGVIAGLPVFVVASSLGSFALGTLTALVIPALILQAALLAYLSSPTSE